MDILNTSKYLIEIEKILSDANLEQMAKDFGIEDKRNRLLPLNVFFWLMLLMHKNAPTFGILSDIKASFSSIMLLKYNKNVTITRMSISKQIYKRNWEFFRYVLTELKKMYPTEIPSILNKLDKKLEDWVLVDSSTLNLYKLLDDKFPSTVRGKAQLKLHSKLHLNQHLLNEITITSQKVNDKKVEFITEEKNVLYIFDLGYWSFKKLDKIMDMGSYFVSRLRNDSNPVITYSDKAEYVGKTLRTAVKNITDSEIDFHVRLDKYRSNPMKNEVRVVGLKIEDKWHFYVTNLYDKEFSPKIIGKLYSVRWQIEILFNELKNIVNLRKIFTRSEQSIQVEIFSALIFYTITEIAIAIAAKENNEPIEYYSFTRSFPYVMTLLENYGMSANNPNLTFIKIFRAIIDFIKSGGKKDTYYIKKRVNKTISE